MKNIKDFINESTKTTDIYDIVSDFIYDVINVMDNWNDSDIKNYIADLHDDLYENGVNSKDVRELIDYIRDNSDVDINDDDFIDDLGDTLDNIKRYCLFK